MDVHVTNFANVERRHLAALLRRVGPDAPTLCEGWDARDLAIHLVIRDSRPDAVAGMLSPKLPVLGRHAKSVDADYREMPWEKLVDLVERPPLFSPGRWSPIDKRMNTGEFFIHHEDVRRAQPDWEPRDLAPNLQHALWVSLRRSSRLMFRKSTTGIVLVAPGHGRHSAKLPDDHGTVVVRGTPAELVLYAYGRKDVARVELSGDADDIAALQQAELGLG